MQDELSKIIFDKKNLDEKLKSDYWKYYVKQFKYCFNFNNEDLKTIRHHTDHITGDFYWRYIPPQVQDFLKLVKVHDELFKNVDPKFLFSDFDNTFGIEHKGRTVNIDILRYQRVFNEIINNPISLNHLENSKTVCEIGAGYGGFLGQISQIYDDKKYIIIDLPETLFFSYNYLLKKFKKNEILIFNGDNKIDLEKNFKFILVPNYLLNEIDLKIDLFLNMASFQEMTKNNVEEYMEFIKKNRNPMLISYNRYLNEIANPQGCDLKIFFNKNFKDFVAEKEIIIDRSNIRKFKNFVKKIIGKSLNKRNYILTVLK